jgi:hypothetical protein
MTMTEVECVEAARRRQLIVESRRASAQGLSIDQYRKAHEAKVANLIAVIRAEMERHGIDDPVELGASIVSGRTIASNSSAVTWPEANVSIKLTSSSAPASFRAAR